MRALWPPLDPAERKRARFRFGRQMAAGETIQSATVTPALLTGTDATPGAVLDGAHTISGTDVFQWLRGRPSDAEYLIRCVVTTSAGQILVAEGWLPVEA